VAILRLEENERLGVLHITRSLSFSSNLENCSIHSEPLRVRKVIIVLYYYVLLYAGESLPLLKSSSGILIRLLSAQVLGIYRDFFRNVYFRHNSC